MIVLPARYDIPFYAESQASFVSLAAQNAPRLWAGFRLTFRVAEPEVLARHLRFSANGVTARRLGGRSEATGAGNPVLAEGGFGHFQFHHF